MSDVSDSVRLQLLEEAHVAHRAELGKLRGMLDRVGYELGIDFTVPRKAGLAHRPVVQRLDNLERGGLAWTTNEARRAVEQLRALRDALDEIFRETTSDD